MSLDLFLYGLLYVPEVVGCSVRGIDGCLDCFFYIVDYSFSVLLVLRSGQLFVCLLGGSFSLLVKNCISWKVVGKRRGNGSCCCLGLNSCEDYVEESAGVVDWIGSCRCGDGRP